MATGKGLQDTYKYSPRKNRSTLNTIFNWMWTVNAAWPVSLLVGAAVLRAAESWSIVSVSLFASAVDSCHGDIRRRSMRIGFVEFAYGMGAIAGYIIASLTYALALPLLTFPLRLACSLAMAPLSLLLVGKSEYQAAIEESDHHHREGHLIGSLSPLSALRTAVRPRDGHARLVEEMIGLKSNNNNSQAFRANFLHLKK